MLVGINAFFVSDYFYKILLWGFMAPSNLFWYGGIATDHSNKGMLSKKDFVSYNNEQ